MKNIEIVSNFNDIHSKLKKIDNDIVFNKKCFKELGEKVGSFENKVDKFENFLEFTNINNLEINSLKNDVNSLNDKLSSFNDRVSSLSDEVTNNFNHLSELHNSIKEEINKKHILCSDNMKEQSHILKEYVNESIRSYYNKYDSVIKNSIDINSRNNTYIQSNNKYHANEVEKMKDRLRIIEEYYDKITVVNKEVIENAFEKDVPVKYYYPTIYILGKIFIEKQGRKRRFFNKKGFS